MSAPSGTPARPPAGDGLRERIARLTHGCRLAADRLRSLLGSAGAPPPAAGWVAERDRLQQALAAERGRRDHAERSLADREEERQAYRELRLEAQTLRARAAEADTLERALGEARERISLLAPATEEAHEAEALRRRERELLVRSDLLTQRVAELQRHADENTRLRQQVWELEALRRQVLELEATVRELEGRLLAAGPSPAPGIPGGGAAAAVAVDQDTVAATVESELQALLARTRSATAVVADRHGLPLAAAGAAALHEELAVVAGLAQGLANQARSLLRLAPVVSVALADTTGEGPRVRLFAVEEDLVSLVLLGAHDVRAGEAVEDCVARLIRILAARRTVDD